jgi:aspartate/methionine/tyrosine aminotransferase
MYYRRMPIESESPEEFGYDKIDFNLAESSFADQRLSDLGMNMSDLLLFYGDHKGKRELRELVAAEYAVNGNDVLMTAGAAPALFIIATALLEKGDEVLVAKTNYATNIETPRSIGAKLNLLTIHFENKYAINLDELDKLISPSTKLVSLTYPHNPTGVTIDQETLQKIISLIERKKTFLLFDETYRDMYFGSPPPLAATLSSRVISICSMSKSYGLPGIRIGWLICRDQQLMETFLAAKEQIFITNSVVDEEIAFHYLANKSKLFPPVKDTLNNNFEVLKKFMSNQQFLEWVQPGGGCVCFPRIKKEIRISTDSFYKILLEKYRTYVGKGHWFEEDDRYMRIGYGWEPTEKLEKGLKNITLAIEEAQY